MHAPQKVVGIPWFDSASYGATRAAMADGADLPERHGEWLVQAEEVLAEAQAAGHRTLKVMVDPKDFPIWCRARNIPPDAKARVRFANFIAFREAGFVSGNTGGVLHGVDARASLRR